EGFCRIADEQGRARALLHAEAFAGRAPTERAVEREMVRVERLEAAAAALAGHVQAETVHSPLGLVLGLFNMSDVQDPLAQLQGRLDGIGDARPLAVAHDDAIDDDFHLVPATMIDVRRLLDAVGPAVDADAHEAAA